MADLDWATVIVHGGGAEPSTPIRWGVAFTQLGDRLSHQVFVEDSPTERKTIAQSVEGEGSPRWPSSPALQQIDTCSLHDQRQGLVAVGLAGTSHWSLAVETDEEGFLCFDNACRVKEQPTFLGSTYALPNSARRTGIQPQEVTWELPNERELCVRCDETLSRIECAKEERLFRIQPVQISTASPVTIRWKYRIRCLIRHRQPT